MGEPGQVQFSGFIGFLELQGGKVEQVFHQAIHAKKGGALGDELFPERRGQVPAVDRFFQEEPLQGDGCLQFVGGAGNEFLLPGEGELQAVKHVIEGRRQLVDFVAVAADRYSFVKGPVGNLQGQVVDGADGAENAAGDIIADQDEDQARADQAEEKRNKQAGYLFREFFHRFRYLDEIGPAARPQGKGPDPECHLVAVTLAQVYDVPGDGDGDGIPMSFVIQGQVGVARHA
ncbi:hypothetical protein BMS3Abin13_01756 [bacterium BMS3Abin13]|nr:hypothetical protein BMS3Abin13_01756 [bacterium BMS3Abin13]